MADAAADSRARPPAGSIKRRLVKHFAGLRIRTVRHDLTKLARCYDTDKGRVHGYTTHYAHHLAPRRREQLNILEIGIGRGPGASLKMWQAYFPKSMIYGIDIREQHVVGPRIRVMQGDQSDTEFLIRAANTIGAIDVVIDDGSHVNAHVRSTFQTLFPYVNAGGYYIIEDLHTSYFAEFGGAPPGTNTDQTSIGLVKQLVDGINHEHFRIDDYVASYTDEQITAVHVYEKIAFIEKRGAPAR